MKPADILQYIIILMLVLWSVGATVDLNQTENELEDTQDTLQATKLELVECKAITHEVGEHYSQRLMVLRKAVDYDISIKLSNAVYETAVEHDLQPWVLYNLVDVESDFRSDAVSYAGAIGLTQIKPLTARSIDPEVTREDLFDSRTNLNLGAAYLASLLDRYGGDLGKALAAYNAGPTRHDRAARTGEYDGTSYAQEVLR